MREARAQQDELDAEDQPEGAIAQVFQCDSTNDCHSCTRVCNSSIVKRIHPLHAACHLLQLGRFACYKCQHDIALNNSAPKLPHS